MNENGIQAWKNDHAITVVFPKPSKQVCEKWQMALGWVSSHSMYPQVTHEHRRTRIRYLQ